MFDVIGKRVASEWLIAVFIENGVAVVCNQDVSGNLSSVQRRNGVVPYCY